MIRVPVIMPLGRDFDNSPGTTKVNPRKVENNCKLAACWCGTKVQNRAGLVTERFPNISLS